MAGFVNNSQIVVLTSAYSKHFNTFKKQIVIVKEPVRTEITTNTLSSPIFGYGEESQISSSFSYTTVTGVFDAQITEDLNQKVAMLEDIKNSIPHGTIRIKIQQDAYDFIEDGRKTDRIDYADQSYNQFSLDGLQNFFGLKFYTYTLERTT